MKYYPSMSQWTNDSPHGEDNRAPETPSYAAEDRMNSFHRPLYTHTGASSGRPEPAAPYGHSPIQVYEDTPGRYFDYGSHQNYHESWIYQQPQYASPPFGNWNRSSARLEEPSPPEPHIHSSSMSDIHSPSAYSHSSWGHSSHNIKEECLSPASETGQQGTHQRRGSQALISKKFACGFEKDGEDKCLAAFARKADRDRHLACVHHKIVSRTHPCSEPGCSRNGDNGFTRKDHLTEHERNYHHKDIPKRSKPNKGTQG